MAALDDTTVTIDTGEMVYVDQNGIEHTVTNGQTFVLGLAAGVVYTLSSDTLTTTDGGTLSIELDPTYTRFVATTDATAEVWPSTGTIMFNEDPSWGGGRHIWDVRTVTIDNVDEPTELTEMVLERRDDTNTTMTLSAVTMSQ